VSTRLVLIRHAKAEGAGATDEVRRLSPRGLVDAAALGRWLVDHDVVPDYVVVSPAVRAIQTWEAAMAQLGGVPPVAVDERIYDNTVEDLLAIARESTDDINTLALVGHNPSMHALAATLDDGHGDPTARGDLARSYPTSGVAVFDVRGRWGELQASGATLREFVAPRG
jgi:phosphohistidine phosphatase